MIKQILIVIALMNISSNAVAQKIDEKKTYGFLGYGHRY